MAASTAYDRRARLFLATAGSVLQAVCLFMIPLVYECDASMYFNYSPARTYRGPLYPAFLYVTGQHLVDTFWGTVIAQGIFGVLSPMLLYAIVAPASRRAALVAASVYLFSFVPFTAAKLMLAEQLFTFVLLSAFYAFTRYWTSGEAKWLYATTGITLCAMFTRWEGEFTVAGTLAVMALLAWQRGHLRHAVGAAIAVAIVLTAWSAVRATVVGDPALFGSIQNGTGDQLFWRFYGHRELPDNVRAWEAALGRPDARPLISVENGPETRRLAAVIRQIASRRRTDDMVFRPGRGGFVTELGGDPDKLVQDIFDHPDAVYPFSVPTEIRQELGTVEAERLLLRVGLEAVRERPAILLGMTADVASFLGFDLRPSLVQHPSPRFILAQWREFQYANAPFNLGNCATNTLPTRMVDEYRWDQALSRWRPIAPFVRLATATRAWTRNLAGVALCLVVWFLPFSRMRHLAGAALIALAGIIGVVGVLGGGADLRYEYATIPLMLIVVVGGTLGISGVFARVGENPPSAVEPLPLS